MTIKTDLHTHSIFSGHAYSTIEENIRHASELGLEAMGFTDHFSGYMYNHPESLNTFGHMLNLKALPEKWYGVKLLRGAEADIVDLDGHLYGWDVIGPKFGSLETATFEKMLLGRLDYVIASVHFKIFTKDADIVQTTQMYCNALRHPKVLMLGHVGRAGVPFDMDEVLKTAKSLNKMIEINEATFDYPEYVTGVCRKVAERCAELGVKIAVNSDAHSSWFVGNYQKAPKMLEEIHFPEELIGNRDLKTLNQILDESKVRHTL